MSNIHDDVMSDIKALRAANKAEIAKRDAVIKLMREVVVFAELDAWLDEDFDRSSSLEDLIEQADAILEGEG